MNPLPTLQRTPSPALRRLNALAPLDRAGTAAIEAAVRQAITVPIRRDIVAEGRSVGEARIIVEGWAARVRIRWTDDASS